MNNGSDSSGMNYYYNIGSSNGWNLIILYSVFLYMNGYITKFGQALVPYPSVAVDRLMNKVTPISAVKICIRRGRLRPIVGFKFGCADINQ